MTADPSLPWVDGLDLSASHRGLLRPGEFVVGEDDERHRLPRYFYKVESWASALETFLTPHFGLWEFMNVDLRESLLLREFPRYIPCAVSALAAALEGFRLDVGAHVRIAANGGYRSPAHRGSHAGSVHSWGTASNIYQIGSELLDAPARIERYGVLMQRHLPFARIRPSGENIDAADDHLHVDVGYLTLVPWGASEESHESSATRA